ncbi:g7005 [Coccomyxa elongata]
MLASVLQAELFKDAEHGDIAPLIRKVLKPKVIIESPVFFRNRPALFGGVAADVAFDITGVNFLPCAVIAAASGVTIRPSGIIISPEGLFVAPWGVNVNPLAINISPTVLVVAPFDTTVAGQGLNIAPALIAIAPIRTVVSSVGPLAIYDTLVSKVVPAIPDPPSAGPGAPRPVPPLPNVSSLVSKLLPPDAASFISRVLPTWANP